jgi:hypothetical protein
VHEVEPLALQQLLVVPVPWHLWPHTDAAASKYIDLASSWRSVSIPSHSNHSALSMHWRTHCTVCSCTHYAMCLKVCMALPRHVHSFISLEDREDNLSVFNDFKQ